MPFRALLLLLLYCLPILITIRPVTDPDIWWHLREGQWIVEHQTVPVTDPFSSYGAGKRWLAYSWLFEVLVYGLCRTFGLLGLVLYTASLAVLITGALHGLMRRLQPDPAVACALTASGIVAMVPVLVHPRPWLLTILFFVVELLLITACRRTTRAWPLVLLPPVFVLWANINIQFLYGLFVLGVAAVEPLVARDGGEDGRSRQARCGLMATVLLVCGLATLVNPYGIRVYMPVFDAVTLTQPFLYLQELQAPGFRSVFDWTVLGLTLGAAFALGRRKDIRSFPALLLAPGVFLSFRAARDVWFIVVVALMILAGSRPRNGRAVQRLPAAWLIGVAASVAAVALVSGSLKVSKERLAAAVGERFPAAAAAAVEQWGYPGPIYNDYDWGGYLIWRLPALLVSMDGRNPLHGDARILRSVATWSGREGWDSDDELLGAGIVVGNRRSALVSLLRRDARFDLAYEDSAAAVFVRHR